MAGIISFSSSTTYKPRKKVNAASTVTVEPAPVHHIEADQQRPGRCLKHLIKANHVNYAVVSRDQQRNNTNAHCLSNAFLLGANENHLNAIFNEQIKDLEAWTPSPAEVIDEDWRDFVGNANYQRAFVDFFEDKLAYQFNYDWKQEIVHVLTSGDEPLIHCMIGGFGHALNHLALAYELDSKQLAMEGLSLACIKYNVLHKYLDDDRYTRPSSLQPSSLKNLIAALSRDERVKAAQTGEKAASLELLVTQYEDVILDYWNAWTITDATTQLQQLQQAAVHLFSSPETNSYNFYDAQVLSASYALRVLLPHIPAEYHLALLRQWWLLAVVVALFKRCPDTNTVNKDNNSAGRGWKHVIDMAINGPHLSDADYLKAIRAIKEAATMCGDVDGVYISSALRFIDGFNGWQY